MQQSLLALPPQEKLRLAMMLIDSALENVEKTASSDAASAENGLLALAGRYEGGTGETAERARAILESEVDPVCGLGVR